MILSIDPGNSESAYVILNDDMTPADFGKIPNDEMLNIINNLAGQIKQVAIEMIASYGMAVGKEVFETCVWIGRFYESAIRNNAKVSYIYRKDVKINLCGSMKAKDSNIRQALIDRFGVVGTKNNKGYFYGFKADIWSAYAVGITYLDKGGKDE